MARIRYMEDAPLDDQFATALGHMLVQWGHLEDNAIILTAVLLKTNHFTFRSAGVNLQTSAKFDALSAVAALVMTPRKAATIKNICEAAKGLAAERNRVMHGSWYPTAKPHIAERYAYSARGKLEQKIEKVSAKRIAGYTREVANLRRRLNHALSREGFYRPKPKPP